MTKILSLLFLLFIITPENAFAHHNVNHSIDIFRGDILLGAIVVALFTTTAFILVKKFAVLFSKKS